MIMYEVDLTPMGNFVDEFCKIRHFQNKLYENIQSVLGVIDDIMKDNELSGMIFAEDTKDWDSICIVYEWEDENYTNLSPIAWVQITEINEFEM